MIDPSLFTLFYDRDLARGLTRMGHQVTLYGRRPGPADGDSSGIALEPHFYRIAESVAMRRAPRAVRLAVKGIDHAWSMLGLLRRLQRERLDVIHFQWLPLPLLDGRFLSALGRLAPLVLTVHDTVPFNGDPTARLQGHGFFSALSRFDALVVHTQQGLERLRAAGLTHIPISVIPIGVTPEAEPEAGERDATITFLLFGKIKPYKGLDVLIEAFARMPPHLRAKARLRVVGKPYMDLAPVRALACNLGVEASLLLEPRFVADAEIPSLFGRNTIAVFPYREIDGSGVLVLAIGYARPVIASRLGCFGESIVDGVHGHLTEPGDAASLAAAMTHMMQDPAFTARCAAAMQSAAAAAPGWDEVAQRTAAVYDLASRHRFPLTGQRPAVVRSTQHITS
jgi:glycosyltransferase involved in cell wall biosynthesis